MKPYTDLVERVLRTGARREDRTGVGTRSIFGAQLRFDLALGFPATTVKRLAFRVMTEELLWMLRGETNVRSLQEKGVHIWDEWANDKGELGPVYGSQWVGWTQHIHVDHGYPCDLEFIDQIAAVLESIRENPNSRRHVVSAWNVAELDDMALPPCHMMFQLYVADGKLSCHVYQRSGDLFLGVPFNIASYALLTHIIARHTGLGVGDLVHSFGDAHLYDNHIEQTETMLAREPRDLPVLDYSGPLPAQPWDHVAGDFGLIGYDPHPAIPAPVAV